MKIRWDWGVYVSLVLVALVLALKNPYDTQSLIPNLEPYPDSLFYSYPAMHFVETGAWDMKTFSTNPKIVTPPGFSLYLMPFFALRHVVLDFFWAQIIVLIGSMAMFILIMRRLFPKNVLIQGCVGFLMATHFYMFTMPSLLMGELISLLCFLVAIYGLLVRDTAQNRIVFVLSTLYLGFIKFSNVILIFVLACWDVLPNPRGWKRILPYIFIGLFMLAYLWYSQIFVGHKNLQSGASFSGDYFWKNLGFYVRALMGRPTAYLWYQEKLISPLVALVASLGFLYGLRSITFKRMSHIAISSCVAQIIFMSFFVTADARYISMLIPLMCLGVGMSLVAVHKRFGSKWLMASVGVFLVVYCGVPQFSQSQEAYALTLKKQIGLNYLHPEQPWNYLALQEVHSFLSQKYPADDQTRVYVGTFLPAHYVSFFADTFTAVPITVDQEFYSSQSILPGQTHTIADMYTYLLTQGDVYVTQAYSANNPSVWIPAFEQLQKQFVMKLVHSGCYDACNVYQIIQPR